MTSRMLAAVLAVAALSVVLTGCATDSPVSDGGLQVSPGSPPSGIASESEVLAQAMVLQSDGEAVGLCLGAVAESYPPQCSGPRPKIIGWDWASVDGEESANGLTWGSYAVQGTWDGEGFTVTQPPILLALYDPMVVPDPHDDPANKGTTSEAQLLEYQAELGELPESTPIHASFPSNGYLFVDVIYDDGRIQSHFDEIYGTEVIVVRSVLRPVTP